MSTEGIESKISELYDDFPEVIETLGERLKDMKPYLDDDVKFKKMADFKMRQIEKENPEQLVPKKLTEFYSGETEKIEKLLHYFFIERDDEPKNDLKIFLALPNDEFMRSFLDGVYNRMKDDEAFNESFGESFFYSSVGRNAPPSINETANNALLPAVAGELLWLSDLTPESIQLVVQALPQSCKALTKASASTIAYCIIVVQLAWDVVYNIFRWYKGEISGRRCAANVIKSIGGTATGMTGALVGATLCMIAGPVVSLIGGAVGGVVGALTGEKLFSKITKNIFG